MDRMIELSPRLAAVGRLVPPGLPLVDVGTDHAYLPAALVQMGRIPSAVAADLRQGPLSRARETVREHGLTAKITFRLCDGLTGIRPEEAGSVAIAGMGGETIAHILAAAPWVRERAVPLILQPMSSQSDLRLWLQQNGYAIAGEKLAREGDAIYTVMLVRAGEMAPLTPGELEAGRLDRDPLRGDLLDKLMAKLRRVLEGLEPRILERSPVTYKCYCSRDKVEAALAGVGDAELADMEKEEKNVQVTCQFCDRVYSFSPAEIRAIRAHAQEDDAPAGSELSE